MCQIITNYWRLLPIALVRFPRFVQRASILTGIWKKQKGGKLVRGWIVLQVKNNVGLMSMIYQHLEA